MFTEIQQATSFDSLLIQAIEIPRKLAVRLLIKFLFSIVTSTTGKAETCPLGSRMHSIRIERQLDRSFIGRSSLEKNREKGQTCGRPRCDSFDRYNCPFTLPAASTFSIANKLRERSAVKTAMLLFKNVYTSRCAFKYSLNRLSLLRVYLWRIIETLQRVFTQRND